MKGGNILKLLSYETGILKMRLNIILIELMLDLMPATQSRCRGSLV